MILMTLKVQHTGMGFTRVFRMLEVFQDGRILKGILGSLRVDKWTTLPGQPEGQVVGPADTRTILLPTQSLLGERKIYSALNTHVAKPWKNPIDLRSTCKKPTQNGSPAESPKRGCPGSLLVLSYFFP